MEMYNVPVVCLPDDMMAADFNFYGHSSLTVSSSFIMIIHSPTLHAVQIKPHEFLRPRQCIQQRLHEKIQYYNFRIKYLFMLRTFNDQQNLNLILLTWRIWRGPNKASKWQIGINSAFKGLKNIPTRLTLLAVKT